MGTLKTLWGGYMDEIEIANLVYRCAEYIDAGELDLAADLFSHARVKLHEKDGFMGREELLTAWRGEIALQPNGAAPTLHLVTNPVIEVDRERGTATCRSCFTVLRAVGGAQPRVVAAGRWRDEFAQVDGIWRFTLRESSLLNVAEGENPQDASKPSQRKQGESSPAKAKLLMAAKQVFSTVGYSEAGIRKIAEVVGVSPTILFRHFGTKAALFEEALIVAMGERGFPADRNGFGRHVADMLVDPQQLNCPHTMTVLATGNEEAREIVARVMQKYAIEPMVEWLGPPNAESRAREIMALCAGFVLYHSQFILSLDRSADTHMVDWLARTIQAIVDGH